MPRTGSSWRFCMDGSERIVEELASGAEPDMTCLQPYDPTEEEQTWPTGEELSQAERERKARESGTGRIQAPDGKFAEAEDVAAMEDDVQKDGGVSDHESDDAMGDIGSDDDNATDIASDIT